MSPTDNKNPTASGDHHIELNLEEKITGKYLRPRTSKKKVTDVRELYSMEDLTQLRADFGNVSKCYTSCVEQCHSQLHDSEISFNSGESAFHLMDDEQ